jgi:hypothetical protein
MFSYFSVYKMNNDLGIKIKQYSSKFFGSLANKMYYLLINYKKIIYLLMIVNNSSLYNKVNVI